MNDEFKKFIDNLKSRISIAEVIKEHTPIKQKYGGRYAGKCPFHKDDTPSFSVDDVNGFFYCFGCLEKGDAISFTQKIHNISFNEALQKLAEKYNITIPSFTKDNSSFSEEQKSHKSKVIDTLQTVLNISKSHLNLNNLKNTDFKNAKIAMSYLKSRGFNEETINFFEFGLCEKKMDEVLNEYKNHELLLEDSGIYVNNYNRFNGRIIIPIKNKDSVCVGFGGRIYKPEQEQAKLAKYINSPETIVFKKNEILFNYHNVKNTKNDYILVVEGYFDVIKLWQAGLQNAVAPMGTNITEPHIQTLAKTKRKMLFCFDNDNAGITASIRAMTMCFKVLDENTYFGFITLQNGIKDPDELITKFGLESFLVNIKNHKTIQQAYLDHLLKSFNILEPENKTKLQKTIQNQCVSQIQNKTLAKNYNDFFNYSIKQEEFRLKYNNKKNKNHHIIESNINKGIISSDNKSTNNIQQSKIIINKIENNIIKILVSNANLITNQNCDDIMELININFCNNLYSDKYYTISNAIIQNIENKEFLNQVHSLFLEFYDIDLKVNDFSTMIANIKQLIKQHQIKNLESQILQHSTNSDTNDSVFESLYNDLSRIKSSN